MRILLYGGSFNPPHLGHIRSVQTAAAALKPDKIFLIPTAVPPHKSLAAGSPPAQDRLEMARLAAKEIPGCEALDLELCRTGPSYTSDTLRQLHTRWPRAELVFLMGTDMLLSLESWHEPGTILSLASVAVFAREAGREKRIEEKAAALREKYGAQVRILEGEPVTVSSTLIRRLLPTREGREYLPDGVYEYIIRHRLYGARPDLAWLRERAYGLLKPKRVPHVQGTEAEARRLAERWGADVSDAAEAAILHDCTKKLTRDEQLRLADKYGIILDKCELENEKLLHARTGAALAADLFGVPEHIRDAIRWHTTARAGMTLLEKIVYLADYIEPCREGFSGLAELRKAAYEDLDGAMELAGRMSLAEVRSTGRQPHDNTVNAQAYYARKLKEKNVPPVSWTPDEN